MVSVYEIRNNLMNYKIVHFPLHDVHFLGEHKLYNTYGEDVGHAILFSGFENDHFVLLCDTDVVFVQPNHVSWTKGNEKHTIEVGSVVTHDDKPFEWYYSPDDSIIKLFN